MNTYVKRGAIRESTSELAKTYSVSSYVVRAVVNGFLVRRGILTPERGDLDKFAGQQRRGRPQVHYKLDTKQLEEELKAGVVAGGGARSEQLISKLLLEELDLGLSKAQQLLLAVLLVYANELGVVQQLGQANLKRLVGMGGTQLAAQIKQLVDKGYILRVLPGGVSAKIFGRQQSLYVLNVKTITEKLGGGYREVQVSKLPSDSFAQKWIEGLYLKVGRVCDSEKMYEREAELNESNEQSVRRKGVEDAWLRIFDSYYPLGVDTELGEVDIRGLFRQLFARDMYSHRKLFVRKLVGYASLYMSKSYSEGMDANQWQDTLLEDIKADVCGVKATSKEKESRECVALAKIILGWAKNLAFDYGLRSKKLQELVGEKEEGVNIAVAVVPGERQADADWLLVSSVSKV